MRAPLVMGIVLALAAVPVLSQQSPWVFAAEWGAGALACWATIEITMQQAEGDWGPGPVRGLGVIVAALEAAVIAPPVAAAAVALTGWACGATGGIGAFVLATVGAYVGEFLGGVLDTQITWLAKGNYAPGRGRALRALGAGLVAAIGFNLTARPSASP